MTSPPALFDYRPARWSETVNGCAAILTAAMVLMVVSIAGLERLGVIPADASMEGVGQTLIMVALLVGLLYGSWYCARYENQRTEVIRARLATLDKDTLIAVAASPQVSKGDRVWVIDALNQRYAGWVLDLSTVRAPH